MKIRVSIRVILALVVIQGCSPKRSEQTSTNGGTPPPAATAASDSTVHFLGFGPVHAGMTLAEAEQAWGDSLSPLGPGMEPCYYVVSRRRPDIAFMVIDGRIARVDVRRESSVKTDAGAGVGDNEERIRSLYPGQIEVEPHKYVEGHYLIVRPAAPADSSYRIIFETDGQRVTSYRAGRMPEVRWIEGCS